jgi:hypothetical protein
MRRKPSASHKSFQSRVRALLPVARELIERRGIDHREHAEFSEYVPVPEPRVINDAEVDVLCDFTETVFELGIAVGLLLSPEVLKGGAR